MRCPKCHYLSFEPEPRCRNCGFDLSGDPADLALKVEEPSGPMADLALRPAAEVPSRPAHSLSSIDQPGESVVREVPLRAPSVSPFRRASAAVIDEPPVASPSIIPEPPVQRLEPPIQRPEQPLQRSEPPAQRSEPLQRPERPQTSPPPAGTSELPLFVKGMAAVSPPPVQQPDIQPPPARPPLAVQRRAQQPPPRPRPKPEVPAAPRKPGPFDGDLLEDLQRIERIERGHTMHVPVVREIAVESEPRSDKAEPWRGLLAAAVDAVFIGLLNVAILWITLRWSDLAFVDASLLPALPLGTFFVLVGLGYLLMFTAAGGQTVGKMIAGVRVVAGDSDAVGFHSITVQQAAIRSVLAVSSVLALGLGFLPALLGSGKSLHDRIAHTRIVRA